MCKLTAICCMLFLIFCGPVLAQKQYPIDKGSIQFSGNASIIFEGGDIREGSSYSTIQITTGIGYFIVPNILAGGNLTFLDHNYPGEGATLIGLGPKVAYYFGDLYSETYPYLVGSIEYASLSELYSEIFFYFGVGLTYMATGHLGFTGEMGFQLERYYPEDSSESVSGHTVMLQFGLTAFLF
jgi:hypothetical protein